MADLADFCDLTRQCFNIFGHIIENGLNFVVVVPSLDIKVTFFGRVLNVGLLNVEQFNFGFLSTKPRFSAVDKTNRFAAVRAAINRN